jgi:predicted proteasome-type protease
MTSSFSLLTKFSEPLELHLLDEHHRRYERIKAWREAQDDPYFTAVTPQWRREFERRKSQPFQSAEPRWA